MDLPDSQLAAELAGAAGAALMELRTTSGLTGEALRDAGDKIAQDYLDRALRQSRPQDAILSEEAADDRGRLVAHRVWIIDPLDGTREFSEPPRTDWAVHVALWEDGELSEAAVARPALKQVYSTADVPEVSGPSGSPLKLAASRTRAPRIVEQLRDRLGAEVVTMGSAGVKVLAVVTGEVDAYVHAGGQYEWDSAAPVAVARAAGLHASRIDGSPLVYNREDPTLPDLIVCRQDIADQLLGAIAELTGAENADRDSAADTSTAGGSAAGDPGITALTSSHPTTKDDA